MNGFLKQTIDRIELWDLQNTGIDVNIYPPPKKSHNDPTPPPQAGMGRTGVGVGIWDPLSEGGGGSRTPLPASSPPCHRKKIRGGEGGGGTPRGGLPPLVFGHLLIQACPPPPSVPPPSEPRPGAVPPALRNTVWRTPGPIERRLPARGPEDGGRWAHGGAATALWLE